MDAHANAQAGASPHGNAESFRPEPPEPLFRTLAPAEPLPLDALPKIIRAGVEGVHGRTQAPHALGLGSVLSTASLATAREADVRLFTGQTRPAALYLGTIAETGERKTTNDIEAGVAIGEWEKRARGIYDTQAESFRIELAVWETREAAEKKTHKKDGDALRAALKELGPPPDPPRKPDAICDEPTVEGLWLQLKEGPGFAGVFNAEGGQFIGGHAMNADNKLKSAACLSQVWDGAPWRRARRGDGVSTLENRRVCLHLMIQPRAALGFLSDPTLRDQGILSRIPVAAPESAMGTRFGARTTDSERDYALWVAKSCEWWRREVKYLKPGDGALNLRVLELSPGAKEAIEAFARHVERHSAEGGAYRTIAGFANKLAEHATRFAAVFAFSERPDGATVTGEAMEQGIVLAQWYASEALRLFDAGGLSPKLAEAERLRAWLMGEWQEDSVSLPDIYQRGPQSVRDANAARGVVEVLERHRYLIRSEEPVQIAGLKRREAWRINREPAV